MAELVHHLVVALHVDAELVVDPVSQLLGQDVERLPTGWQVRQTLTMTNINIIRIICISWHYICYQATKMLNKPDLRSLDTSEV